MGTVESSQVRRSRVLTASLPVLLLAPFLALAAGEAGGQEIRGRLLETGTAQPIPWANLALLDTTFTAVAQTLSDQRGAFVLEVPAQGSYYVLAEALGYQPKLDGILEFRGGGSVSVEFYLRPKPLEMDSLKVALKRVRTYQHLNDVGYYDREKMGFGTFLSPDIIERRKPFSTFDLLRGVPGLYIEEGGRDGTRVFLIRGGYRCNPAVYVDGSRVFNDLHTEEGTSVVGIGPSDPIFENLPNMPRDDRGIVLERMVDIEDISAVEVHTRSTSVPLLYGGTQETCGVLLVWTHLSVGNQP
jgi:hypothetical protein